MTKPFLLALLAVVSAATVHHETALLQTMGKTLNNAAATPVKRVVNLLKEMSANLQKEQDEDESLYKELMCWCHNGSYAKGEEIDAAEKRITELTLFIETSTATISQLQITIKSLREDYQENNHTLVIAIQTREKKAKEFKDKQGEDIAALESLKAAIIVLSRHAESAFPQIDMSLIETGHKDFPWASSHESQAERSFDDVMQAMGTDVQPQAVAPHHFLQQDVLKPFAPAAPAVVAAPVVAAAPVAPENGWTAHEMVVVRRAMKTAGALIQRRQGYYPSYSAQSGEILGVLKQLYDQMKADLSDAQKAEESEITIFIEMRTSKTEELESQASLLERKEEELSTLKIAVANAKEELTALQGSLSADQKFLLNLKKTCKTATEDYEKRKAARLAEITAVSDTIGILTADESRDKFTETYSFMQISSQRREQKKEERRKAAAILRLAAAKARSPELSIMATSVELDAFTKVKEAMDTMMGQLKQQQKDEVAKSDYCKAQFLENELATKKASSEKEKQESKIEKLAAEVKALTEDIDVKKGEVASLQLQLQGATNDRIKESMEYQKAIADQRVTQGILKQALDRLKEFYDKADLMQVGTHGRNAHKQDPPVLPKEYSPSKASAGVMEMISKLITDAKGMEKDTKDAEQAGVDAYTTLLETTNENVAALLKEVMGLSAQMAETKADMLDTEGDLKDTTKELEGLVKSLADLHAECDYVLKNFDIRQAARAQEIQALIEAKAILSGA